MNPEKSYKGCGVVILALFLLSVATNVWLIKRGQVEPEPQVVIEHDTLWRDTTITKPVAADSTKTGEVVYIRIPYPSGCQSDVRGQDPGSDLPGHCPLTSQPVLVAAAAPQPAAKMKVITERDIPITRPENYQHTPEELALLKKQAAEAYLKWVELELEISRNNLEQAMQK